MKLLLVTQDFPPRFSGGIAAYYANLCRHVSGNMDVLTIACDNSAAFDTDCPFEVFRQRIPAQAALSQRRRMSRVKQVLRPISILFAQLLLFSWHGLNVVRQGEYDLVIMGHLHLLPIGLLLRRLRGCRFGVILHGGELEHYWHIAPIRRTLLWVLDRADLIVANSDFTREQYYQRGVRSTRPIHVVHPGVDTEIFGNDLSQPLAAAEKRTTKLVLLTVGRLVERKGHAVVLKALARLDPAFPNWEYRIVGTGSEQENLVRLADDLHIRDKVQFLGFVPDAELPACYAQADMFVMPSQSLDGAEGIEGFGIVYLEAAAYGIPSVAGRSGGVAEAVVDGETGILVDPHNVVAVSDTLLLLLSNENVRSILGEAARTRVLQELNWFHQGEVFLQAVDRATHGSQVDP